MYGGGHFSFQFARRRAIKIDSLWLDLLRVKVVRLSIEIIYSSLACGWSFGWASPFLS